MNMPTQQGKRQKIILLPSFTAVIAIAVLIYGAFTTTLALAAQPEEKLSLCPPSLSPPTNKSKTFRKSLKALLPFQVNKPKTRI